MIVTFPFLFGVMFGDVGHGLIMLTASCLMIKKEKSIEKSGKLGSMFEMLYGGRYIIFLMSLFSIYCGLIYNDVLSKSINLFGSSWSVSNIKKPNYSVKLDPTENFHSAPFFGMDPIWQVAQNKISWLNSFKMKNGIVLGILQMCFGLYQNYRNTKFRRDRLHLISTLVPQILFLSSIFVYLVFCIFYLKVLLILRSFFKYAGDN